MKTKTPLFFVTALLAPFAGIAQQQPSPQPAQAQAQPAPCVTTSTSPNPSGNKPVVKVPSRLRQMLDKQRQQLGAKIGVEIPDVATDIEQAANAKPAAPPCIPQAALPKAPQPVPISHLPNGVITTWLCNPIVTSTDPSHTVTFITPDALTVAEPAQAGAFEADGAKADPKATVSCANLRRDPKTNKVFLAQ